MDAETPGTGDAPAIEARGLTRSFGKLVAVDHVDLTIPRARIYGFLGPNGSGKSTTIRMLCGLLEPSAGSVRVLGHEMPRDAEQMRAKLGYMTQRFSLWDDLTVHENLNFMARIFGLSGAERERRIAELAAEFELEKLLPQRAGTMSGGQRQRLALAAATLHRPELLLLDEPTSAVDPRSRRDFWESLFVLVGRGTTILVSTHYMDEAERCHRLAILDRGRLVGGGRAEGADGGIPAIVVEIEAEDVARRAPRTAAGPVGQERRAARHPAARTARSADGGRRRRACAGGSPRPASLRRSTIVHASLEDVFVAATGFRRDARPEAAEA